jgi:hypothetical protein
VTLCGRLDRINYARAMENHVLICQMARGGDMYNIIPDPTQRQREKEVGWNNELRGQKNQQK